jgi:hypothetical protein
MVSGRLTSQSMRSGPGGPLAQQARRRVGGAEPSLRLVSSAPVTSVPESLLVGALAQAGCLAAHKKLWPCAAVPEL